MANPDSSKVSAMKPLATGGVLVAPYGTALPPETTPTGTVSINSAFQALGYMAQDTGVSNAEEVSSTDVVAWGGAIVLNVSTSRKETYVFKAIEQNVAAWKLRYGTNNVSGTDANAVVIHDGASFSEYHSIIVAEQLGDGRVHLSVIPKAKLESADSVEHKDSDPLGYGMPFTALAYSGDKTSYDVYYTPESATTATTTTA